MPARFLPTHGLTREKSGLARQAIFFRYSQLKNNEAINNYWKKISKFAN